jgi:hypothetical protein
MATVRSTADLFRTPPVIYRPMPQWSWNGELTEERITEQLEQFAAQGAGGLFAHARAGLITPYLSERWLDLWGHALCEAERLGLEFHIYDEFCVPAGVAGGRVIAERPHLIQQELLLDVCTSAGTRPRGEPLAFYRREPGTGRALPLEAGEAHQASLEDPLLALTLQPVGPGDRWGGLPGPDLCRRETTDTFLAVTHDRYAERYGDRFGQSIRFVFSDEPQVLGRYGLPFSRDLLKAFRRDHGYDLEAHLAELCFFQEGSPAVRYDYFWTLNRLFNAHFMVPMHDWCAAHGLLFTGHLMEHEWPSPRSQPDAMASMRWMQAPGNDLLGFQFKPTTPADNGIYILNLKELSSLANQLGREWTLVETCGGAGYGAAFDTFKPLEDLVLAHGVNVIDPHLSHETVSGARKYDWAQTLSDHSPWWAHYRPQADHVARVNAALSQGQEHNRVLLLHPTTSAWLHYTAPAFRSGGVGGQERLAQIRASQIDLLLRLYGEQVDFDLGDEFILEEIGRIENDRLVVGERAYEAVVLPPGMENWTASTLALLARYLKQGGRLLALRDAPAFVDGRPSDRPAALQREFPTGWQRFSDAEALVAALRKAVPPRIASADGEALPSSLCWRRVELADGRLLYFFCNPWAEALHALVRLEGRAAEAWEPATGEMESLPVRADGVGVVATLDLPPSGHALWLCDPAAVDVPTVHAAAIDARETGLAVPLELLSVERQRPNLLMIDYCDLEAEGVLQADLNTIHADKLNWQLQGYDRNPWREAHQFKRATIDRPIDPESSLMVRYRFTVGDDLPAACIEGLRVGLERPWLYEVRLNGRLVPAEGAPRWFDEHMRALPISAHVRRGENVLTLEARPFHVLCEIMPVYLIGDFGLTAAERGFLIGAPVRLGLGDWTAQGLPFYPDVVRYEFRFQLPQVAHLALRLPEWRGSVAIVRLDGQEAGKVMGPAFELALPGPVSPGSHRLSIDVIGNMRNMMGPHFDEGLPIASTWEKCPPHMPPGDRYRTQPSGLLAMPVLLARHG